MKNLLLVFVVAPFVLLSSCEVEVRDGVRYNHHRGWEHSHYPDHHEVYHRGYHHDAHRVEIDIHR